uniref:Uncharacterized protein n=1 Tax=Corethron hystrix TaxID=216773 RepID=A0A7S1BK59_9STRA|mmetsp:Transcript_31435/g.71935  ORF Transcript_31435/g.71935 Transcript_31435/m.71935 type:complete len:253 (+) Transcript_31435:201-959(+)
MSARIDLSSGGGFSNWKQMCRIGRTKPAIIDHYMSGTEWTEFCDDIDEALEPLNRASKYSTIAFFVAFVSAIISMIFFAITIFSKQKDLMPSFDGTSFDDNFGSFDDDFGPPRGIFYGFGIIFVTVIISVAFTCNTGYKWQKSSEDIEEICAETSERQPRLSFHVRFERYYTFHGDEAKSHVNQYIEVLINQQGMHTELEPVAPYAPASSPYVVAAIPDDTVQQRLKELEEVKHLLTEIEYSDKRTEILTDL